MRTAVCSALSTLPVGRLPAGQLPHIAYRAAQLDTARIVGDHAHADQALRGGASLVGDGDLGLDGVAQDDEGQTVSVELGDVAPTGGQQGDLAAIESDAALVVRDVADLRGDHAKGTAGAWPLAQPVDYPSAIADEREALPEGHQVAGTVREIREIVGLDVEPGVRHRVGGVRPLARSLNRGLGVVDRIDPVADGGQVAGQLPQTGSDLQRDRAG
ncbi:hypothetical protein LRS74_33250 [Streptomyces sp. LX-29]|uniref:hypothetical protein n=1 Tax=Streptomyces sp. LX-29 TaxID=2900152 RepID=UPI00240E2AE8|nr:hypothetical protein [Streptomyces sp. LX-29]WFB11355.1 hypothetical protein LRS74_33250 [Streptomyces sp. LX-29]